MPNSHSLCFPPPPGRDSDHRCDNQIPIPRKYIQQQPPSHSDESAELSQAEIIVWGPRERRWVGTWALALGFLGFVIQARGHPGQPQLFSQQLGKERLRPWSPLAMCPAGALPTPFWLRHEASAQPEVDCASFPLATLRWGGLLAAGAFSAPCLKPASGSYWVSHLI